MKLSGTANSAISAAKMEASLFSCEHDEMSIQALVDLLGILHGNRDMTATATAMATI